MKKNKCYISVVSSVCIFLWMNKEKIFKAIGKKLKAMRVAFIKLSLLHLHTGCVKNHVEIVAISRGRVYE